MNVRGIGKQSKDDIKICLWKEKTRTTKKTMDKRRGEPFQEDDHPVLAIEDPRCIGVEGDFVEDKVHTVLQRRTLLLLLLLLLL
jgi:hypothetical protein